MASAIRSTWRFSTSDEILFGCGAAERIGVEARYRNLSRALIVADPNMAKAGLVDVVRRSLDESQVESHVFDGSAPEPGAATVNAAAEAARVAQPDFIIGLGGGSNMDVAKVAAAIYTHGGSAADYFGENHVPGPTIPVFAVPTTAGTGSEVTAVAVIEDETRHLKLAIASPHLRPRLAIVDPLLTLTCPAKVTAESGMDALVHAVEACTVIGHDALDVPLDARPQFSGRQPITDALAEQAIRLVGRHLRAAVYQPKNIAAREGMHLAALLAGMAFSSAGLGAAHALQYPVGAVTHTPHGLGTGLLLPYVVAYLLPAAPEAFARIASWLGEDVDGMSAADAAHLCVEAIQRLKQDVGLPMRLRDIGVREEHLRPMAEQAITYTRLIRMSPRPIDIAALEGILRSAW
ncbi:MAG: iron-containing alcohol dehydrogenase [Anaerolineae bacterium]|nr:iron-containing alcohol dehydrogenase [Candidatus Roseilinea sp.]MDW8451414.1 iron-containing alcohol dehydrogenase [Anaerolineae bacterium]